MAQLGQLSQRIPTEVLESVIALASEGSHFQNGRMWDIQERMKTLLSCTLVCRAWITTSRIYLYQHVSLNCQGMATKFMTTIISSPQLGEYVQSLQVVISEYDSWIYTIHRVLPPLLPNLYFLRYHNLPPLLSPALLLAPGFKNITCLALEYPDPEVWIPQLVFRFLNSFPKLKMLEMSGLVLNSVPFDDPKPNQQDTIPTSFHLRCYPRDGEYSSAAEDALLWLSKRHSTHTLNEFWLACDEISAQSQNFNRVLQQSSGTMNSLRIWLDEISHWSTLGNQDPSNFMLETTYREVFSEDSRGLWAAIDTALTSKKFPKLNYFELSWNIEFHSLIRMHNTGVFEQFVPNLYKQGVLWSSGLLGHSRYPVRPSTHTLSPDDLAAWERLSRISPFPEWANCYPEFENHF
ncbi:hypothetical protein NLI96_g10411 [Meripilus lineatus]|uniref:F-box domain-containing protein n=1 Tax=Meripilus lineatus TaxID=2056292 RepID=A0AAD5UYY4_9APHY|nr:hypothetical protein NLI96_g10411 [Physisporinus lineatus]